MRIRYLLSATAVAALSISPAFAQEATAPEPPAEAATALTLGAEQQASFDAWPSDVQAYFRTLSPERQALFFRISDENKVMIAGLPPEQQEQAWAQIEAQASAIATPTHPDSPATEGGTTDDGR